jgi:hypothetical protein
MWSQNTNCIGSHIEELDMTANYRSAARRWNDMFERLVENKLKHGQILHIPRSFSISSIGKERQATVEEEAPLSFDSWLDGQRKFWNYDNVKSEEIHDNKYQDLVSLGVFETTTKTIVPQQHQQWNDMYANLVGFKQQNRVHLKAPQQCNENPKLGKWMYESRESNRKYKRTYGQKGDPEQIKDLESIGLADDISNGHAKRHANSCWGNMLSQALEFKQNHGHLKVPSKCKLGRWVVKWRRAYKEYKMTNGQKGDPLRMRHLESIGLVRDISNGYVMAYVHSSWDDMFNLLLEFKHKHGHFNIPRDSNENQRLLNWVTRWKGKYREYKITNGQKGDPERMKRLESVGLVDDISTGYEQKRDASSSWDDRINQVLEFKRKHGHPIVPSKWDENPKLGRWVKNKRYKYREYKISNGQKGDPEQMKRLESIGLVDDIIRKYENKKTSCVDNEVSAPITVSSMSPTFSSNIQNITEEISSSMRKEKKQKEVTNFLGSELRGGFWA